MRPLTRSGGTVCDCPKSDVDPSPETIEHYRAQVRTYLDVIEAERGLVVLSTSGPVIPVARAATRAATS